MSPGLRELQRGPRPGPCLTPSGHLSPRRGQGKGSEGRREAGEGEGVEGLRKRGAQARARRLLSGRAAPPLGARAPSPSPSPSRVPVPAPQPIPPAAPAASASGLGRRPPHPRGRRPSCVPERAPGREARISKVTRARVQKAGVTVAAAVAPQRPAPQPPSRGVKVWARDPAGPRPESRAPVGAGPAPSAGTRGGHFRRPLPPRDPRRAARLAPHPRPPPCRHGDAVAGRGARPAEPAEQPGRGAGSSPAGARGGAARRGRAPGRGPAR